MTPFAMGIMVAAVAGLMIHISCTELLPTAWREGGKGRLRPLLWLVAGFLFVVLLGKV